MMEETDEKQPLLGNGSTSVDADEKKPLLGEDKPSVEVKKSATFGELFRYATCGDKLLMFIGALFSIVHGGGWPALSIIFGQMTNDFVSFGKNSTGNSTTNASSSEIEEEIRHEFEENMTRYAIYYLYIGGAVFVASYFQIMCWATSCERQCHKIRHNFFASIMKQEIKWFDNHQSGELTTRLSDDLERIREGIGDKISFLIQYLSAFIAGFTIGFWKSWKLTLVMLSLTPLMAVCATLMSKLMVSLAKREQDKYAKAGSVAEEVLSCVRTVISFNGQKQETERYEAKLQDSKRLGLRKSVYQGTMTGFTYFVMFSMYGLAFWYGTELYKTWLETDHKDGLESGEILTVFFCVMIGSFSLGNAVPSLSALFTAKGAAAVLMEIIDNKPLIDATSGEGKRPLTKEGNIHFKDVYFSYPAKEKRPEAEVLKGFNMTVKRGQTVALVGPSGCGKSTVMSLVQRFYDPKSGSVYFEEENLKDLNVAWLRQCIGVVSQEPVLFGYSILENIKLGNPDATMYEIEQAAKEANAHDFISQLPEGYNTLVGERGAQLSGGQKQRVAIARALVRNPSILLLDEATSALDSESEKVVQVALDKVSQGRTTIIIAHRLSTIQGADLICVMDSGKVFEQGKHVDLMEKKGLYYELVMAQSLAQENSDTDEEEGNSDEKEDEVKDPDEADQQWKEARANAKLTRRKSRKSSGSDTAKLSRRFSRQQSQNIQRQISNKDEKKELVLKKKEEKPPEEEFQEARYCRILHENTPECCFIITGCTAAAISGVTMPAFAVIFGEMINVFINGGQDSVLWSMMFVGLGGANFLTYFIQTVALGYAGENMTMRLRLKTFIAMLRQDVAYFDDPTHSTGALTTRLATDASLLKNATGMRMAVFLNALVSGVTALGISFFYGWKLALVVLGAVPLMMAAGILQLKVVTGQHKGDQAILENAGKVSSEAIENIRTVQSLGRESFFYRAFCDSIRGPYRTTLKQAQLYGLAFGFSQGIVFMCYGGAFRFGAWQVGLGDMAAPDVFKVFFAIAFTGMTIGQVSSFLPDYSKAKHAAGLIFKTMDTVPPIDVYSKRGTYLNKMEGEIQFKGVNFKYPSRPDVQVLTDLSISIQPGSTVALVGSSGCGKSTVFSLLQRYYDPGSGDIAVDGNSLKDVNLFKLRSFIGVVSQEPILFDCSFKENIAYGLDYHVGMDQIIEAARAANIHEFISSLPMGYETDVGEKGTQLSGGQKQRVAIARALIRNPRILLLDEATSALDSESEKLVQSALDNVLEGRTCIIIAHRLSTIQNCDLIYVMDSGQVVEQGTHQQLLAKNGVYSALVKAQKLAI